MGRTLLCGELSVVLCQRVAMSSVSEVDAESLVRTHSPDGAVAEADDGHHPLRRMFSASVLGSLLGTCVPCRSYNTSHPQNVLL